MITIYQEILALETECLAINQRVDNLFLAAEELRKTSKLTLNAALEADQFIQGSQVISHYFSSNSAQEKVNLALEEINAGIVAAILAGIAAIVALIAKFISYLRGKKTISGGSVDTSESVNAIVATVSDRELLTAVDDAIDTAKEAYPQLSLEDISAATTTGISIMEVFEHFKSSLNEPEVDFLTSGQRYKTIKDVVDDFVNSRFPDYIDNVGREIEDWSRTGLDQTPHIGKDEDVVERFTFQQRKKLDGIISKYYGKTNTIQDLERVCAENPIKADYHHLELFGKKPSMLFPHLEHLWKSIHFERLGDDDKRLINSLEKVQKRFEENARKIKGKMEYGKLWPAEEAMLRLVHNANRDVMKSITGLMRVSGFIRSASTTAYQATMKSFGYITRMLNSFHKLPNIDKERLQKCVEVISQKRKAISDIANLV